MQVTNEYTFEEKHFDTVKLKYVKSKTSRNKKSKNKDQKNSLNISSIIHKERIPIKEKIFHIDFFYSDLKKGSHKIKIITNQSVSTKNRSFQDLTMKNNRKRNFLYFLNEHSENYYKLSNEKKIQFVKNIPTIQTA
ncbi:hypothetical protein K9L67_04225, partial [Candidatus Woesearchaeota archaeon]|nr:hypothetical protein [Candidatus Woesearchaeota archaeon]